MADDDFIFFGTLDEFLDDLEKDLYDNDDVPVDEEPDELDDIYFESEADRLHGLDDMPRDYEEYTDDDLNAMERNHEEWERYARGERYAAGA
jgi:hypothetical protein